MNKKITPLEALNYIKNGFPMKTSDLENALCIVETALKRQEQDKKLYDKIVRANLEIGQKNCQFNELVDKQLHDLNKLDRFVAIIKEKKVNIGYLLACYDYEDYLDYFNDRQGEGNLPSFKLLTKEEFDLLKEVLL